MRVVAFVIPLIAAQLSNWQLQQKYRELKSSLDPLKVKANRRFNAYDYTLEQIGKRLFALEENLAEALHRNENQDATIKELIHAQLLCGCPNDKAQRAMNQKPVDVGVNLLLELMLSPRKKIAKTGPLHYPSTTATTTTTTRKTTTTTKRATTTTTTTRTTTHRPSDTVNMDTGGFGGTMTNDDAAEASAVRESTLDEAADVTDSKLN